MLGLMNRVACRATSVTGRLMIAAPIPQLKPATASITTFLRPVPATTTPLVFKIPIRSMANHRHKKFIKLAKGFLGRAKSCYKIAKNRVDKARQYSYRHRKVTHIFIYLFSFIFKRLNSSLAFRLKSGILGDCGYSE